MPNKSAPRLLADVGGTNARFALAYDDQITHERTLTADAYPDFASAVSAYLEARPSELTHPREAAFAFAAPIVGDHIQMTNRAWAFSAQALRARFDFERLIIVNDFTALAMSLRVLPRNELEQIGGKQPVEGSAIALIGPGTGLGVSGLVPHGRDWLPLQGEGGHVTLPVESEREAGVLGVLRQKFGHVSAERVVSGPGLVNLYESLCALDGRPVEPLTPAEITKRALEESSGVCTEVLEHFCAMLGTVAGNLVLTLGALGGLYIGGGIVPKLGERFARTQFRQRFEAKGRYQTYLRDVPVYIIRTAQPAFLGLARTFECPGPRLEIKR